MGHSDEMSVVQVDCHGIPPTLETDVVAIAYNPVLNNIGGRLQRRITDFRRLFEHTLP